MAKFLIMIQIKLYSIVLNIFLSNRAYAEQTLALNRMRGMMEDEMA